MPDRTNLYKKLLNLFCNSYLEVEGNVEKKEGKVQEKVGQIKKVMEK